MKLFSQSIAVDLGTANTIIMQDNQIVVDEPSVVAIRVIALKVLLIGPLAKTGIVATMTAMACLVLILIVITIFKF